MFKMLNQHMTSGRRNKMVEYSASKLWLFLCVSLPYVTINKVLNKTGKWTMLLMTERWPNAVGLSEKQTTSKQKKKMQRKRVYLPVTHSTGLSQVCEQGRFKIKNSLNPHSYRSCGHEFAFAHMKWQPLALAHEAQLGNGQNSVGKKMQEDEGKTKRRMFQYHMNKKKMFQKRWHARKFCFSCFTFWYDADVTIVLLPPHNALHDEG